MPIRRRIATAAMLSALAVGLTAIPAPANSDRAVAEARCDGTRVAVLAAKASDRALICAGARDAVGFMKDQGLDVGVDVVVEVVTRLPDELSDSVVGCYVPSRKRVFMLPYAEFARHTDWFGLPIEPALYRSLASHEVAHAVSGCNFSVAKPSLAAWEYVAYVVMLSVMAPDLRDRLLAQIPGGGFESNEQIHSALSPARQRTRVPARDPVRKGPRRVGQRARADPPRSPVARASRHCTAATPKPDIGLR